VGVHDRLGPQARRQLALCRLGGIFSRAPTKRPGLDRLTYQRVILGVLAVAPQRVVAVRPTRHFLTILGEPAHVNGLRSWPLRRPGLDASLGEQLGVQRIADGPVDFSHVPRSDVGHDVVGGVVPPVLRHRRLDRMLDPGQPFVQGLTDFTAGRADQAPLLVLGHRVPASPPCLALCFVPAPVHLSALAGQRIRFDIEPVIPALFALVDATLHAASSSVSMNSRSLAETT
jgi:hypothetical protein